MDAETAYKDLHRLFALDLLIQIYRRTRPREEARKRIELMETSGPSDLVWFDLRWPEEPP